MSSDKKSSTVGEPEYQYTGEEEAEESLEVPMKRPSMLHMIKEGLRGSLPKKKSYRVLLFLGIAIYMLYKFLNVGTLPPKEKMSAAEKVNTQQLTKTTPPATAKTKTVTKTVEKKPPAAAPVVAAVAAVEAKNIDLLKDNKPASATASAVTSTQIKDLQNGLDQMNRSVSLLETSLGSLTNSVIRLADKVNALEKTQPKNRPSSVGSQPTLVVYYLQSLTGGRAWVQSPTGDFTSVKVGDSLPGYGEIQKIDVAMGLIITSSGRTISYGPNDN